MHPALANHNQNPPYPEPAKNGRRITEVIVPFGYQKSCVVLPLAASLSHSSNQRWTTWITQCNPHRLALIRLGANVSSLRLVRLSPETDCRWLIWEALKTGSSQTVIVDHQRLSENDLNEMEKAAQIGKSYGIIVRQRNHQDSL